MKKTTVTAALSLMALLTTSLTAQKALAQAHLGTPLYTCRIEAELEDRSWAYVVGRVKKVGTAEIKCISIETALDKQYKFKKLAHIEIKGPALGLDINFKRQQKMYMVSAPIAVRDVSEMFGKHRLGISANANLLFIGVGAQVGVEFGDNLLALNPSVEFTKSKGIEATLSFQKMTLTEIED